MPDLIQVFAFARRIAEAIAEGRLEASAVPQMTDEQLAEYDAEVYQGLVAAQERNEDLAKGEIDK